MRRARSLAKSLRQIAERIEAVNRAELIHIRHHGADARCLRLEPIKAQQRIEPDDVLGAAAQALHFPGQLRRVVALQAIGHQQHIRALR